MRKHAYLILAHNEFEVLQRLLNALDDERNDVFIHIDKRVKELPDLKMEKGHLHLLQDRIKTFWGDSSLIEAELLLLQTARQDGNYQYYHIVSGVHFPLKGQDFCHRFFEARYPCSLLTEMETDRKEIRFKAGRFHYFVPLLAARNPLVAKTANFLWRALLFLQKPFPPRNIEGMSAKDSQWCSLTDDAAAYLIDHREEILARFRHTFCCDEFFIPASLCKGGMAYESIPNLLFVKFQKYSPKTLTEDDFDEAMSSGCLFARKFGTASLGLINIIENELR